MIGPKQVDEAEVRESHDRAKLLDSIVEDAESRARNACTRLTQHTENFSAMLGRYEEQGLPIRIRTEALHLSKWNKGLEYRLITEMVIDNTKIPDELSARKTFKMYRQVKKQLEESKLLLQEVDELCEVHDAAYERLLRLTIIAEPFRQREVTRTAILYLAQPGTDCYERHEVDLFTGEDNESSTAIMQKEDHERAGAKGISKYGKANLYVLHKPGKKMPNTILLDRTIDLLRERYFNATGTKMPEDLQFRRAMNRAIDFFEPARCTNPKTFTDFRGNVAGFTDDGTIPKELADSLLADDDRGMVQ